MPSVRSLFLKHVAQTSPYPMTIEVERSQGMYLFDIDGKAYMDLDSGFSVSSLGHRHPRIIAALQTQMDKYLHTTVYGEHIHHPQVNFATMISTVLGGDLDNVYYTNAGAEAVEVAIKVAKKYTGRYDIISCRNAYHGSSIGAESLRSDLDYTAYFMPAMPGVSHIDFNATDQLECIDRHTAAIILEVVQAEAGVICPANEFLSALRKKCDETGCLLIFDEIQTGFGRTGHMFAFQKYGVTPDILLVAKAMGGGMPVGATIASKKIMSCLTDHPMLGHINTFGGHPMSIAAAVANLEVLLETDLISQVSFKEQLFHHHLIHPKIKSIRSSGLLMAVSLTDHNILSQVVDGLRHNGYIVDYFLFNKDSFRIAPPLIIDESQIIEACQAIKDLLDYIK